MAQLSAALGYPIQAIHIPKTVDNDLPITDCCPGFGSVAKYVATSIREAGYDGVHGQDLHPRCSFWKSWAVMLAGSPPPVAWPVKPKASRRMLLFPEIPFEPKLFLDQVDACVQRHGYCVVAVSEGIRQADGRFIASGLTDAFGHAQLGGVAPVLANLVKSALGYKYHWAVADYLQRAARHLASAVDVEQAWALGAREPWNWRWPAWRGDADHRAPQRCALPMDAGDGGTGRRGQCGKIHAKRIHQCRRISHH